MLLCCDDCYYLTQKSLLGTVSSRRTSLTPLTKKRLLYFAVNKTAANYSWRKKTIFFATGLYETWTCLSIFPTCINTQRMRLRITEEQKEAHDPRWTCPHHSRLFNLAFNIGPPLLLHYGRFSIVEIIWPQWAENTYVGVPLKEPFPNRNQHRPYLKVPGPFELHSLCICTYWLQPKSNTTKRSIWRLPSARH